MVDIKTLQPGDTVKIVNQWCGGCFQNYGGAMDHWLGKTMTVKAILTDCVQMEEDASECLGTGWYWFPAAIERVIDPGEQMLTETAIKKLAEADLMKLMMRE